MSVMKGRTSVGTEPESDHHSSVAPGGWRPNGTCRALRRLVIAIEQSLYIFGSSFLGEG